MSVSGSASGGAVKRQREQEVEEDEPALLETTVHPLPLMLLVLVKAHFDTLVWLQLCNPQGVALFSFVRLPPRLPRPFAGAAVYDMSLTHAERLCAVGCGFKGRLVRLLSLGVGRHFEPQRNWRACHQMMQILRVVLLLGWLLQCATKLRKRRRSCARQGDAALP